MHTRNIIIVLSAAAVLSGILALSYCFARPKTYELFTLIRSYKAQGLFSNSWAAILLTDSIVIPEENGFLKVPLRASEEATRVTVDKEAMSHVFKMNGEWGVKSVVQNGDEFRLAFALEEVPNPILQINSRGDLLSAIEYPDSSYGAIAITNMDGGFLVLWAQPTRDYEYQVIGTKLGEDGSLSGPLFRFELAKGQGDYAPYEVEVFWPEDGRKLYVVNKSIHGASHGEMDSEDAKYRGYPSKVSPGEVQVVLVEKNTWRVEDRRYLILDTDVHPFYPEQMDSCLLDDNLLLVVFGLGAYLMNLDNKGWNRVERLPYFAEQKPCFPFCVEKRGQTVYWIDEDEIWALPLKDVMSHWNTGDQYIDRILR